MSKQNHAALAALPKSLSDAGYKIALSNEATRSIAQYVLEQCPGFLDETPAEVKTALYAGFQTRKHELSGETYYKMGDGGTYIPVSKGSGEGLVCMTINAAMSFSAQEFGKMRESDPARHAIIKPLRDAFSSYASNNMASLRRAISGIVNESKPRARAANKAFREAMTEAFNTYEKRVKTAKDRGDTEADPVKFKMAVAGFWKIYDTK